MHKHTTYKEKIAIVAPWLPAIVDAIKRDLKQEHLARDWGFAKQYFPGKNPNKLTAEEMHPAYSQAVANSEKGEELAEFISNRWLLKHSDLYYYFEKELSALSPNFSDLEEIDAATAKRLMHGAVEQYGALNTYLFCVFNSVVFPKEIFQEMSTKAAAAESQKKVDAEILKEKQTLQEMKASFEQQLARQEDKYEKKLAGLQKKYHTDIEALKKQIASLQRKVAAG